MGPNKTVQILDIVESFRQDTKPHQYPNGEKHEISKTERDIGIVLTCIVGHERGTQFLLCFTNNQTYRNLLKERCNLGQGQKYQIIGTTKTVDAEKIAQVASYFCLLLQDYNMNWLALAKHVLDTGQAAYDFFKQKMPGFC